MIPKRIQCNVSGKILVLKELRSISLWPIYKEDRDPDNTEYPLTPNVTDRGYSEPTDN